MTTSVARRFVPTVTALLIGGGAVGLGAGVAHAGDSSTTTTTTTTTAVTDSTDVPTTTAASDSTDTTATTLPAAPTALGANPAAGVCAQEHHEWTGPVLLASFSPEYDTGIVITAPPDGGSLRVIEATYVANNAYVEQLPEHTRANDGQQNESFALFVGDTQVGGLTPDLPDIVDEGAVNDWNSGDQVGSFGAASVSGGRVLLKHSFLFGFAETANSIDVQLLSIDVERCGPPIATTTTVPPEICTCPPTTEATTTTVEVAPVTEPPVDTTSPQAIENTVPTTTPFPTTTAPTTTTEPILVATGATSGWIVGAGSASLLSGLTLLRFRRRGRPA